MKPADPECGDRDAAERDVFTTSPIEGAQRLPEGSRINPVGFHHRECHRIIQQLADGHLFVVRRHQILFEQGPGDRTERLCVQALSPDRHRAAGAVGLS